MKPKELQRPVPPHPMKVIKDIDDRNLTPSLRDPSLHACGFYLYDSVRHYFSPENIQEASDGYHTFGELYRHRHLLFIALCKKVGGSTFLREHYPGWDCVTLQLPTGQISYHLPMEYRPMYLAIAKEVTENLWDGHTSNDVLQRLADYVFSPENMPSKEEIRKAHSEWFKIAEGLRLSLGCAEGGLDAIFDCSRDSFRAGVKWVSAIERMKR